MQEIRENLNVIQLEETNDRELIISYFSHLIEGTKEAFVHRDICSRNILLRSNKSCVIAGFGLAKQVSGPGSVAQEDVSVLCTEVIVWINFLNSLCRIRFAN